MIHLFAIGYTQGILQLCAFERILGTESKEVNGPVHEGSCGICVVKV